MSHTMSPARHDSYVERRKQEKERNTARKRARQSKRMERHAFTH
jgi:hypothetical protein